MNRDERRALARMERRNKPVARRAVSLDPMQSAKNQAGLLTSSEREQVLGATRRAIEAMRTGCATADDWSVVVGSLSLAYVIQRKGVVKVFSDFIVVADKALSAIEARATKTGPWVAPTLYAKEIEALGEFMRWHTFQVEQLSFREVNAAITSTDQELRRSGREVHKRRAAQ